MKCDDSEMSVLELKTKEEKQVNYEIIILRDSHMICECVNVRAQTVNLYSLLILSSCKAELLVHKYAHVKQIFLTLKF
jgi:hypothetical protein